MSGAPSWCVRLDAITDYSLPSAGKSEMGPLSIRAGAGARPAQSQISGLERIADTRLVIAARTWVAVAGRVIAGQPRCSA